MRVLLALLCGIMLAVQCGCGGSKLSLAAVNGNLEEVQSRVKAGEKINEFDRWGWTPLMWSVYYGNFPVAKFLLDNGADPNLKTQQDYGNYPAGTTALILAAAYGHDDAVAALLKKHADASVVDQKGKTAIDYAQQYNFDKCVALLSGK